MIRAITSLAVLLVLSTVSAHAVSLSDFAFEASLGHKYESNLLSDWTQISDYTSTGHFAVKAYPLASLELSGSIDRSLIRLKEDTEPRVDTVFSIFSPDTTFVVNEDLDEVLNSLSSVTTGVHLAWIPTSASSRLSVYLNGGVGRHEYDNRNTTAYDTIQYLGDTTIRKRDFKIYSTTDYDFTTGIGYQYSPKIHLRSELAFNYHDYTNSFFLKNMVHSNQIIDAVVGGNWSITGTNVLDLELGYSAQTVDRTSIDTAFVDHLEIPPWRDTIVTGSNVANSIGTFFLSPRLSRQLGSRTGVNLTGTLRTFVSGSDIIVAGETAELLDPFATAWEGAGLTLNIKTFLIPRLTTSLSFGYWDKGYLKHEELRLNVEFGNYVPTPVDRDDTKKSVYLGFQMPMAKTWAGLTIEPVCSVEYSDNSSTIDRYDYYGWDVSLGVSLRR